MAISKDGCQTKWKNSVFEYFKIFNCQLIVSFKRKRSLWWRTDIQLVIDRWQTNHQLLAVPRPHYRQVVVWKHMLARTVLLFTNMHARAFVCKNAVHACVCKHKHTRWYVLIMFIPPTFRRSNHILPSVMSRLPAAFHSEMRHYAEVKHALNFRFTTPLSLLGILSEK